MKNFIKKFSLVAVFCGLICLGACSAKGTTEAEQINIAILKGPTALGALNIWSESESDTSQKYNFQLVTNNDEVISLIQKGDVDMACISTNLAATLYNKSEGELKLLAVNTGNTLKLLSIGYEIGDFKELAGRTIYSTGQGANPEYILRYLLEENGLDPDSDVSLNFVSEPADLASVWSKDKDAFILAPEPMATSIMMKFQGAISAIPLESAWQKIAGDAPILMGCIVVREDFYEEHKEAVQGFMSKYKNSVAEATSEAAETAKLAVKYGIIENEALANKILPNAGILYLDGENMRSSLSNFYQILNDYNPSSIGGKVPDAEFYE